MRVFRQEQSPAPSADNPARSVPALAELEEKTTQSHKPARSSPDDRAAPVLRNLPERKYKVDQDPSNAPLRGPKKKWIKIQSRTVQSVTALYEG